MKQQLNRLSIRAKLGLLLAFSLVGMVLITAFSARSQYLQGLHDRKGVVQHTVESASGVLQWAYKLETAGKATRAQAQDMAKAAIGLMRYDGKEYFWINDLQGIMVMHPIKPDLVGKPSNTIRDPNGFIILEEAAKIARNRGSGYMSYFWPKPGKDAPVEKISYVQHFEPWGWVVGSGLYVDDLRETFLANALSLSVQVAAVALVVGWLAWGISRSIARGIGKAVKVLHVMAEGDLTVQIQPRGTDEVARLLHAMVEMQAKFTAVVRSVRQGSESVSTASTEIAAGNQDLSARTEAQASALQETAASMEQLGATVNKNADSARQGNQLARDASAVAIKGGEAVNEVVKTMQDINASSRRISDIIQVIDGIAFQTNILALNAAVEAARAGEQGRGFAVVASEVRALASRSAEAAKEIKGLIQASVERVEDGTALVDRAGATMSAVVESIQRVTELMGEISNASNEQAIGVAQVGEAVSQMDQTTQHNAAMVEEIAASAAGLKAQADDLVQNVAVFKLGELGRKTSLARLSAPSL